ncbi:Gfo/Idh/MocA family protein [Aerococcus kribbianus]|uniref:Gfo/Idh/MocA family oxidoreductase n=1 Tax=Aerococcus kribbianus TaxID=2999064 RepID=A0A9X3JEN7_9LACT|nr:MULTISPECIES: Gfo/Idh/MocA family oxidoreductase [unclassified Aerococcus]MCZ0717349.1 Gfo/Idh/MocA family oxidoreductase [Aerococcus sp. YH-aer221]MCZ0725637.1 Gfo/Idh/MocA family oxidoreductase [Aerococcus sp. YH-aer222]
MLKVGIIGLGTISYIHHLAIEATGLAEIVAVCDINPATQNDYPDLPFYTDMEEMLDQENLDVVHICLPHYLHVPAAKTCIDHGVHVYLEKPLAMSYQEGRELADYVESHDSKVAVSFQNRYNKTSQELHHRLKKLVSEDNGRVLMVKGIVTWFRPESYYEAEPWRGRWDQAGGGTIANQSIHTLDLMQWFTGQELVASKGKLIQLTDYAIEVEDTATADFTFTNDVHGIYYATNAYQENSTVLVEVVTNEGRYVISDNALYYYADKYGQGHLICQDDIFPSSKSYYGMGHKLAIQALYEAIINNNEDYISVADALPSMMMIDLLKQSSQSNQKVNAKELL